MNTAPAPVVTAKSPLAQEMENLKKQIVHLRDCILNQTFKLTLHGAERRMRLLILLFLVVGFIIGLRSHPLPEWTDHLRKIFIFLFNPAAAQTFQTDPFSELFFFALGSVDNLLRYLPIFFLPFYIALHSASLYLADIFEKPLPIARHFIWEVALGGSGETITIREGEFINKNESRIYTIGGPGYVIVEHDSAALFERPDGRPHIIGPTVNGPVLLDGFERFRSAIDLRDQHFDFKDQQSREVVSRSLDGILVSAVDVAIRFSIWRGAEKSRSMKEPNPFRNNRIIEDMVYGQAKPVVKIQKEATKDDSSPIRLPIAGMIRSELASFMSERKLTEFLSSFGAPEIKSAQEQTQSILQETQKIIPPGDTESEIPKTADLPKFTPRSDLSARFKEDFASNANRRGAQLDWIGVGTWKTPDAIVPNHHLDAWRLSLENETRGSKDAIAGVEKEASLQKTIQLIQTVPLMRYLTIRQRSDITHREALHDLLIGYREQIVEAKELLEEKKQPVPAVILNAILHIEIILGWNNDGQHWVGNK